MFENLELIRFTKCLLHLKMRNISNNSPNSISLISVDKLIVSPSRICSIERTTQRKCNTNVFKPLNSRKWSIVDSIEIGGRNEKRSAVFTNCREGSVSGAADREL